MFRSSVAVKRTSRDEALSAAIFDIEGHAPCSRSRVEATSPLRSGRVVLVAGEGGEVTPLRLALEAAGIFTVICQDAEAIVAEGFVADLEIVCCKPSRPDRLGSGRGQNGADLADTDPANRSGAMAKMARIARHPVPVIFVHASPSVWDVNYLRSCGAFYVLDRHVEEESDWQGLRDTVACALAAERRCAFCNRITDPSATGLKGAGQVVACRDCVLLSARDLIKSENFSAKLLH